MLHKDRGTEIKLEPIRVAPDWRRLKGPKLLHLEKQLAPIEKLETPMFGQELEHNTMYAALLELEIRFQDDIEFLIVPPQVFVSLSSPEGIQADHGGENQAYIARIKTVKHVFVAFILVSINILYQLINYS